ncbi:Apolipoprotein D [Amphibalanus amphitrite]|uniref:Apolipoprotein D n=1 Tax=Amphibalanus amphitrite TaxID=1232801 RepID=A0A6A4WW40_AMPAM|nr:Apolipoprotein D [Amphibalanus amphitrite]
MELLRSACGVLVLAALATAHVNHRSSCPIPTHPMKGFVPNKFLGEWYVMRAFDPDVSCLVFNYTTCGEGCLRVVETKKIDLIDNIGISNVYQTEGTLKIDGSEPSEMTASFTTNPRSALYTVLATDYTSFAAVYTCQNVGLDALPLYHRRDVYLLARDRNTPVTPEVVEQVSAAMVANMIEDEFAPLDHNSCQSAEEADVSVNVSKIGQRVSSVASTVTEGLSKFASSIAGIFSSSDPDPASGSVSPLRRRRGAHF